jgi:ubiquinone/menaquinone biosynthesis C-methylase UbiE
MSENIWRKKMEKKIKKKYSDFYKTKFGKKILEKELDYILKELKDRRDVLSVGCGPAFLESELAKLNPHLKIIGLDISKEMLEDAPNSIHVALGDAECMRFEDNSFDALLYVTSLEFIVDYKKAVKEAFRVLKLGGKVIVLMLNPKSHYFQQEYNDKGSYIRRNIKHIDIEKLERFLSHYFSLKTEYYLGIKNESIFDTANPKFASLYIVKGIKRVEGI